MLNSSSNVYNKLRQAHTGPGGIHCPCCTDFNTTTKQKRFDRRRVRRELKSLVPSYIIEAAHEAELDWLDDFDDYGDDYYEHAYEYDLLDDYWEDRWDNRSVSDDGLDPRSLD